MPDMKLFAGNATPELAQRIANRLYTSLGDAAVGRFSDGEVSVQINENVRGGDIFIIQSTCAPTNDNLMELVVMVDALASCFRRSYHRRYPLLWLCTSGPSRTFRPCADYRKSCR
ncbi:ribose-phosphate pyrophosphokinase [Salmonella enterica subsp. enterica]|uniref:Ribose-phosphate pyrophosphokinase n=1 Tax=Salmonella enterica I TaxID=59201 RepID=A0A379VS85_SALET|nr:ribose-phosphate pyrophosphokinase [Salmonella enterica subsp. enterica]